MLLGERKEIIKQIEDNQRVKQLELEEKRREGKEMVEFITQLQEEQKQKYLDEILDQRERNHEIWSYNEELKKIRAKEKEESKLEDERIMQYLVEKEKKEVNLDQKRKELQKKKEMEIEQMRKLQEKDKDLKLVVLELQDKRTRQKEARAMREREVQDHLKAKQLNEAIKLAREEQINDKKDRFQKFALREQQYFEDMVEQQRKNMMKDQEKVEAHQQ